MMNKQFPVLRLLLAAPLLFGLALLSCNKEMPPEPVHDNPYDVENPDAVPEIMGVFTDNGNEFTHTAIFNLSIVSRACSEVQVSEVEHPGDDPSGSWYPANDTTTIQINLSSGQEGIRHIACRGRTSYRTGASTSFQVKLDRTARIDTFNWTSTGGYPVRKGNRVIFTLNMSSDYFGAETGGVAMVNIEGWNPLILDDIGDGMYSLTYSVWGNAENAAVTASFTDRAGNEAHPVISARLLNTRDIIWSEHTVDGTFDGAYSVYATDVDGDGDTDVLSATEYANDITWWENVDGTGLNWAEHTVDGSLNDAYSVYATDMDGDGDTDVLGAAEYDGITWWENVDGSGLNWVEHMVDGSSYSVYATDMDGDGDTDVLGAAEYDGISWWENVDGSGLNWAEHTVDGAFDYTRSVYATDVNGDGGIDVLGAANVGAITWWENLDGSGLNWAEHTVDEAFDGAYCVYTADVDGDGDTDVLGAAYGANDITWWENLNGSGLNWVEHSVDGNFDGAASVYAIDVDGDGDIDVLGAAWDADDITWWENLDGAGLNWVEHTVDGEFDYAVSVYATDIDGDGYTDVLGAAHDDGITWWENR